MDMKKVLILGAGYGGIFAAANLIRENRTNKDQNQNLHICLVDKNPYHQLLQQIHHIIAGSKDKEDITINVNELFINENDNNDNFEFIQGIVSSIDLDSHYVSIIKKQQQLQQQQQDNQQTLQYYYDYLIIALGAVTEYFGIKGVEEHSLPFRSVADALKIKERIINLPIDANVVIVGGGPTGVSLSIALSERCQHAMEMQKKNIKIKIIDGSDNLLSGWDPLLSEASKRVLHANGIEILTGSYITEIDSSFVKLKSGDKIPCDVVLWTAGVRGQEVKIITNNKDKDNNKSNSIQKTKAGRIVVDDYSRIPTFDNVFAIGDISAYPIRKKKQEHQRQRPRQKIENNNNNSHGIESPQLAQFAVRQARFVSQYILKMEKRGERDDGDDVTSGSANDELEFNQRGHTIAFGERSLGLLHGLLVTDMMCEYTEDSIVDNFIKEIKNKEKGISAHAIAAVIESQQQREEHHNAVKNKMNSRSTAFDFVYYATSQAFLDLVR
jgi:NADH:ubiquinone reductase (H+-translocating)